MKTWHIVAIGAGTAAIGGVAWYLLRPKEVVMGELKFEDMAPAFTDKVHPRRTPPRFIVVHHSVTSTPRATRRVLAAKGGSTHFEVDQNGKIYRYLDPAKSIAIHGNWTNSTSIGIDLTHLTNAPWPPAQVAAMAQLVASLCAQFNIPRVVAPDGQVYPSAGFVPPGVGILRHRNVRPGGTLCPQNFPMDALGPVQSAAKV